MYDKDSLIPYNDLEKSESNKGSYSDRVSRAKEWSEDAIRAIITPVSTLEELDDQWNKFNSMIKKNRRESDWKSIELFGISNQEHYEIIRNKLLDRDIENAINSRLIPPIQDGDSPVIESYIDLDAADSYYNPDAISYTTEDVRKAKEWAEESDRAIIIPTRTLDELETLWDAYNLMIKKHKRESDWMSQELFGITNLKHYEYLKTQFLKEDIKNKDDYDFLNEAVNTSNSKQYVQNVAINEGPASLVESVIKLVKPNKSIYEELIVNNIVSDAIAAYNDGLSPAIIPAISTSDMPYLSPTEMIDMGVYGQSPVDNYFGVIADNSMINEDISVKDWFEMYRASNDGFYTEMNHLTSDWVNKVRELSYGLSRMIESGAEENEIKARKQSILELGWNPDIPFTDKARALATECAINRIASNSVHPKIVNMTEFACSNSEILAYNEFGRTDLKPVYIVMTEGKNRLSGLIKGVTHSIYSHASISFDHTLETMYSYAIKDAGGFKKESLTKDTRPTSKIGVYVFFVTDAVYDKIVALINTLLENPSKTKYSYKNLITFLFNIPYNDDWKMVCSQFVDRCLKVAGIDVSRVDSSLVSPAKLDNALKNEERIYHIYEGLMPDYNPTRAKNLVYSLMKKCKPLKEQNIGLYENENSFINTVLDNARDFMAIQELANYKNILQNSKYKSLLEGILFDILEVKPFTESTHSGVANSISFMNDLVRKFVKPL